jgi:hypothetical protein
MHTQLGYGKIPDVFVEYELIYAAMMQNDNFSNTTCSYPITEFDA